MKLSILACIVLAICPVVLKATLQFGAQQGQPDVRTLMALNNQLTSGVKLSAQEVKAIEQHLKQSPDDLIAHLQLIGFYHTQEDSAQRSVHVLWLIKNHPNLQLLPTALTLFRGDPGYEEGKKLWLDESAETTDPDVLMNAANYLAVDSPYQAEQLLRRGEAL